MYISPSLCYQLHPEYLPWQSLVNQNLGQFYKHTDIEILKITAILKQKELNLVWQNLRIQEK